MSWFFEGNGTQLGLTISQTGNLKAYGRCSQSCSPESGDNAILQYVNGLEGWWSLYSSDAQEHEYDGVGRGLKAFFAQNGGQAAALIEYFEKDKQQVGGVATDILMPQPAFQETLSLFRAMLGNPLIRYVICLDFMGLCVPGTAPNKIPTLAEFVDPHILNRRVYLSHEVSISVTTLGPVPSAGSQ